VPWPKKKYGQFFNGDSYIVLNTYKTKDGKGAIAWDVRFRPISLASRSCASVLVPRTRVVCVCVCVCEGVRVCARSCVCACEVRAVSLVCPARIVYRETGRTTLTPATTLGVINLAGSLLDRLRVDAG
jgi:hypothetical protein